MKRFKTLKFIPIFLLSLSVHANDSNGNQCCKSEAYKANGTQIEIGGVTACCTQSATQGYGASKVIVHVTKCVEGNTFHQAKAYACENALESANAVADRLVGASVTLTKDMNFGK